MEETLKIVFRTATYNIFQKCLQSIKLLVCVCVCVCVCVNFAHRARKAKKRAGKRARSRRSVWRLGTWNVRSMVDTEGPVEVASQGTERGEERKVDWVVREQSRYDVVVGALQETRWFSCGTYEVGDSMVLTSGRSTPGEGQTVQRGKGVALVLRGPALAAWKAAMEGLQFKVCDGSCTNEQETIQ